MDNQIPEDPFRILARERSHEDARQTVATNRMLVQSLVIINGGAATAVLFYYGAHNASGPGKSAALLTIIFYCLGVFTAIFAGLYVSRTTQESSSFWELKSYPDMARRTWPPRHSMPVRRLREQLRHGHNSPPSHRSGKNPSTTAGRR